jgi:hypothetical protein
MSPAPSISKSGGSDRFGTMALRRWLPRWTASTIMTLALITGALCAIGHHLFYACLHGSSVRVNPYQILGKYLPTQVLNVAVGTAFAFLVRAFLTIAISTAYVQVIWRSVRRMKEYPTVGELDWAHAVLGNVFNLFNLACSRRFPWLLSTAIIFW